MPARSVKKRRKSNKQRGGTKLTDAQFTILSGLGFTDHQKNAFNAIVEQTFNENVTDMLVTAAQNDIRRINPQTGVNFTPQNLIDNLRNTVGNATGVKKRRKTKKVRKSKKMRKSKKSKKMYKQRGGAFTDNERDILINNANFTEDEVNELDEYPVSFQNIQDANHLYLDEPNRTMIIVSKYLQDQQNQQQDNHNNDEPLNLEDLQVEGQEQGQEQGQGEGEGEEDEDAFNHAFIEEDEDDGDNTDNEDLDESFDAHDGGRSRRKRKGKKGTKSRKTRKMKGGALYGTGVGANNYNPNYSIYNTPALTLFPYKPN
jgi:hypothetical protein